jgi:uncharacterized protein
MSNHAPNDRPTMAACRVFVAMFVSLLVWTLLFAPTLKRSADASPLGVRRSVALAVLTPFAWVSDTFRITAATDAIERTLGRDPEANPGDDTLGPEEVPTFEPLPTDTGSPSPEPTRSPGGPSPSLSPSPSGSPTPQASEAIRVPTTVNRLRVVVVGDSLAAGLGVFAERVFDVDLVNVSRQGRISTGLARPDYFDWPLAMMRIKAAFYPDLVIVMLGENDNQTLESPGGKLETPIGTTPWPAAYEERVERFARLATSGGGHLVWVGLPVQSRRERWPLIRRQNDIYERVARAVPNAAYFDTWENFSGRDGGYTAYLRRDNGSVVQIREPDGLHFTSEGYTILARRVAQLATERFRLSPGTYDAG